MILILSDDLIKQKEAKAELLHTAIPARLGRPMAEALIETLKTFYL